MVRRAYLIVFFFCIFLSFLPFLLRETHFPTDDLGRHITNGRVFLEGNTHILFQNVYSYTHTEYPFLNHHWLTGVVYAILDRQWGLPSLYLLNSVLLLCSYLFTMLHVRTKSDRILTLLFSIPIFMLFSYRPTIRPEVFGYFFLAYMTFRWSLVRKEQYWSWTESIFYSILMILWVNLHISFILGVFVLSMMMIDHRENLRNNKSHLLRFLLPMMVTILNPSTLLGMIYPLKMFFNYGYPIAENMTPFFMMQVQFDLRLFFAILLLIVAVVCLFFTAFQKNVARLSDWITVCTASIFLFFSVRYLPVFAILALPILAGWISRIPRIRFFAQQMRSFPYVFYAICMVVVMLFTTAIGFGVVSPSVAWWHVNLQQNPDQFVCINTFLEHHRTGAIFNDFDVGGFLDYTIFPEHRVFVDNRPDAFTARFFTEEYIPMQENEEKWAQALEKYRFQTIIFSTNDMTPWARTFLFHRLQDPEWEVLCSDQHLTIFLRSAEK